VRLPILPNNSTGWVKLGALSSLKVTSDHLVVNRATTRAILYRSGAPIFSTRVGVGRSVSPTPRGEFYITEKMSGFHNAAYGPIAFGTNARSAVLTNWPGGGFIGIHGTDAPGLIPGHVSHGCVRLSRENAATLFALVKEEGVFNTRVRLIGDTPKASDVPVARHEPAKNRETARKRDTDRDATRNTARDATRDTSRAYVRNDTTDGDDAGTSTQPQRSRPQSAPDSRAYYYRQPAFPQQRYYGRGLFQSGW